MPVNTEPSSRNKSPLALMPGLRQKRDYALGIVLLLFVVLLWTASNFVTQNLFVGGYEKPFLVTYLNTSAFAFYLIPIILRRISRNKGGREDEPESSYRKGRSGSAEYEPLRTSEAMGDSINILVTSSRSNLITREGFEDDDLPPLTVRETAELAFAFCLLWFIANWSINASLNYTTIASGTILASMSGFFTLIIGRISNVEKLTVMKFGAVFTSFTGVILVSLSDSSQPNSPANQTSNSAFKILERASNPLLGDSLALISALFYAFYVILLKVRVQKESRVNMQLFFGFVGLFNVLACWPIGLLLHWTGIEPFALPTKAVEWYAIFTNMAITLSSDYLYVLAMLKTTPLVVTIGISLTIPLAVFGDFLLNVPVRVQVVLGAILVLISFVIIGSDDSNTEEPERPAQIRSRSRSVGRV